MSRQVVALMALVGAIFLSGCTYSISQSSFFPDSKLNAPDATLAVPVGYTATSSLLEMGGLGRVRAVRLDNPQNDTVFIYSAGNGGFVDSNGTSQLVARLAALTKADIILYDYPGRGGTTIPATIDAAIASGPEMLAQFKKSGWIGAGPVYAYGFSFGGAMAAAMTRNGGFTGLIIEGSAADYAAVGRDFVPSLAKPFVKLKVADELKAFDYFGYAVSSEAPVLLLSGTSDPVIKPKQMRNFATALTAKDVAVTFVPVPVGHGGALETVEGQSALQAFLKGK